ncbi:hypothetical protein ACI79D_02175 [Geodermatophilus sp. SYSU D00708]
MAAVPRVAPEADPLLRTGADPSASDVRTGTRWLLRAFTGLTLLAVVTLLVWPERAREAFAWSIAMEVTAAWLGAAYASGTVLSVLALRRRRWDEIRVAVVTVGVFTALTLVATLVHTHRMHLVHGEEAGRFAAWVWFGVYLVVPVACAAVVVLQEVGRGPARHVGRPLPRWLARLLAAQGAVLAAAGAVLFLGGLTVHHHSEPVTRFWPWDVMPLSSQVIGAWLVALGVGAVLVIRERDLSRLLVPAVTYTLFGALQLVVLARYRADLDPADPWLWGYVVVCAVVTATGGYGTWAARRGPRTAPARRTVGVDDDARDEARARVLEVC